MRNGSFKAGVGDDSSVERVPVAVPHHEASQRVVVVVQPFLEGSDHIRSHVVGGSTC